jgi:protein phosphatase
MLKWHVAALTDAGHHRQRNEDNYYISPDNRVLVVADGMGGASGGELASKTAVKAIENLWSKNPPPNTNEAELKAWVDLAVSEANKQVWTSAKEDPAVRGMGTTLVLAVQSDSDYMQIAHVGDSRCYRLRKGQLSLLTNDHSVVQEMVRAGRLTQEQARVNPYKNLITRCLGHDAQVEIEQTKADIQNNDWIILCSDGLSTVLRDEEIQSAVDTSPNVQESCDQLVKQTLAGGAPDNVTVIVARFVNNAAD